jgi:hypothetical protein
MRYKSLLRSAGYALSAAVLLSMTATTAWAWKNPVASRYLNGPLDVCDQGVFFVGGVPKVTTYATSAITEGIAQQLDIAQMYVQFQIPKKHRQWPVIMVHGGGFTGSCVEATPQGTEGWVSYSVRNNLSTFVVDQAGRGRSGFDNSVLHQARITNNVSLIPTIRNTASSGIFTNWFGHIINGTTILDGTMIQHGDPGDPMCASDPAHCNYHPKIAFDVIDPNIQARAGAIGPAPNPANNTYLAMEFYKWGVPNTENTLPTSTCASCNPTTINAADTWSSRSLAELVAGLGGAIVATHSQSGTVGHHMVRVLKEKGQLDKLKGLITIEGSCGLTNAGLTAADFDNIPYLAFKGDYTNFSQQCQDTVNALNARRAMGLGTAKADYIQLDDPSYGGKFNGTTHMMMMGTNNLEVFDEILKWTTANISNPIVESSCPSGPPAWVPGPPPGKGPKT